MPKVVNSRLVDIVAVKTNIYMPIVEAIANSIDAIEERKAKDGEIRVELNRIPQLITSNDDAISPVSSITIKDNGVGFTDENTDSFDELFSEKKLKIGGKGFGRFTYLKYFTSTSVDSTYKIDGQWKNRKFTFYSDRNEFITNPQVTDANDKRYQTTVVLNNIKKQHQNKLNLKLDTIARKLFEVLLPYFVTDDYNPPKIVIVDVNEHDEVTLNDYLKDHNKIQLLYNEKLNVTGMDEKNESFQVKIYLRYFIHKAIIGSH